MSEKSIEPLPPRLPMNDTEEQSLHDAKEEEDVAEFPEGGFMAWCAVAGSWFTSEPFLPGIYHVYSHADKQCFARLVWP